MSEHKESIPKSLGAHEVSPMQIPATHGEEKEQEATIDASQKPTCAGLATPEVYPPTPREGSFDDAVAHSKDRKERKESKASVAALPSCPEEVPIEDPRERQGRVDESLAGARAKDKKERKVAKASRADLRSWPEEVPIEDPRERQVHADESRVLKTEKKRRNQETEDAVADTNEMSSRSGDNPDDAPGATSMSDQPGTRLGEKLRGPPLTREDSVPQDHLAEADVEAATPLTRPEDSCVSRGGRPADDGSPIDVMRLDREFNLNDSGVVLDPSHMILYEDEEELRYASEMADKRDRRNKRKRYCMLGIVAVVLVGIGAGIAAGVSAGGGGDDGEVKSSDGGGGKDPTTTTTEPPSSSPTTVPPPDLSACFAADPADAKSDRHLSLLAQLDSSDDVANSAQRKALCWLADGDSYAVDPAAPRSEWYQRYILAVFYYALVDEDDPEGLGESNWLGNAQECTWDYVTCDSTHDPVAVTKLEVTDADPLLEGQLPDEIGGLTDLSVLDLGDNLISGTLPTAIGNLRNLTILELKRNEIEGMIPPQVANLTMLETLSLEQNEFTGLPDAFYKMTTLVYINLARNTDLDAALQSALGQLSNTKSFRVTDTDISGNIPTEVGKLTLLTLFDVSNTKLEGELPTELGKLTNIEYLDLKGNDFSGLIPTVLGNLEKLVVLELKENDFMGNIPSSLGNLTNAHSMTFSRTRLTGDMPQTICELRNRNLVILAADCEKNDEVTCAATCCTLCV